MQQLTKTRQPKQPKKTKQPKKPKSKEPKAKPSSYCQAVAELPLDDINRKYHDTQYGFPIGSHDDNADDVSTDNELFGRLILEINQAGLSWTTILHKQDNFRKAYDNFDIATIASYGEADRDRLLADAGIIRNKLKIDASIYNAKQILKLQQYYGSFKNWLDYYAKQQPSLTKEDWVKLFKTTFKFTGGEITGEFLMSTGYLSGAHVVECPIYQLLLERS